MNNCFDLSDIINNLRINPDNFPLRRVLTLRELLMVTVESIDTAGSVKESESGKDSEGSFSTRS